MRFLRALTALSFLCLAAACSDVDPSRVVGQADHPEAAHQQKAEVLNAESFARSPAPEGELALSVADPSYIRVAGIGGNYGNRAANQIFATGDLAGEITRITAAQFNALSPTQLRAAYDVLLFTWATSWELNADWDLRIKPYLDLGGGIVWEDDVNVSDLTPAITRAGAYYYGLWTVANVPGLTDGVTGDLLHNHFSVSAWHSDFSPFLTYGPYTDGVYAAFPSGGRMVITGPDLDYHAYRGGNQYKLLVNEIRWAASGSGTAAPEDQTIDFPVIADQVFGAGPLTLGASASSGLAVTYGASGSCAVDGDQLTLTGVGSCTVTADQAGNDDYNAAPRVEHTFAIAQAGSSVSWDAPADITYGEALSETQLNATSDMAGTFAYDPATGTVLNAGTHTLSVTFTPADANYAASSTTVSITVLKATPTVSWDAPAGITYGTALTAAQLNATASVAGTFSYTPAAGTVLNAGPGQALNVTFTPDDSDNYNGGAAETTIDVAKAVITATADDATMVYGDGVPVLTSSFSGFVNGDNASVVGGMYQLTTTATPNSPAGDYPITPIVTDLTADNYTFTAVNGTLTVTRRPADAAYTGDVYALTAGPKVNSTSIRLAATLTRVSGTGGDLSLARVNFLLYSASNVSSTPNLRFDGVSVSAAGAALLEASVPAGNWIVRVEVQPSNAYWMTSSSTDGVLTIAVPTNERRITGGGWLDGALSPAGKTHFGFTVAGAKTGNIKGNAVLSFRDTDGYTYRVKTNSWQGGYATFAINNVAGRATFEARANVQVIDPATGDIVETRANHRITVDVLDGSVQKPGVADRIAIQIRDANGVTWKQFGAHDDLRTLGNGSIDVKSK